MEEEIKSNIEKLRNSLKEKDIDNYTKIRRMALLRYYLGEQEKEEEKVKYNKEFNDLDLSESIEIGKEIIQLIAKELQSGQLDIAKMQELHKLMKDNFYYLARYLFSYYLIAIEFGIPKEKQFYAPRDMVLGKIAKRLDVFYYKPRAVLALNMPQGTGKEQPLSSKILTPTGWITMGDVKIGTKVIGADGKSCNVTGVYPKGVKDVYRVTFKDNSYVDCGLEHLWEVQNRKDRNNKKSPKRVIQLKDMLEDFRIKEGNNWYNNYSVRLVQPIEFEDNLTKEDINPYVLGALIANGSLEGGISFSTFSKEVVNNVKRNIFKEDIVTNQSNKYVFGIKRKDNRRTKKGYLIASQTKIKLNEYELYGKKSENKFIPKKYLYSSIQNRVELLRGLMDNDGTVNNKKTNTSSQYTTTSKQLCYDVLELVRSLGGKASYSKKESYYKKDNKKIKCKDVYNVYFTLDINPYSIKEKAQYYKKPTYCRNKYIINIEKVRQEECQCIMVDSPEHLYVTDGYTLTHNTELRKKIYELGCRKKSRIAKYDGFIFC